MENPYGRILTKDEMKKAVADVSGIVIGVDPLDADVIAAAPKLRAIAKYGVGTDNIDLKTAQARGIPVSITRGANAEAVADYAFTLMAACARRLVPIDKACHRRDWSKASTIDIYGKTLGILGLGAIGRALARRAAGFGMQVMAFDVFWDEEAAQAAGIIKATPAEIYATCDFISLHLPLTDETRGMVGQTEFARMKPTAVLVNTARGGLIDEDALVETLREGRIWAAGIDAFAQEPPENEALYELDNLIMGAHCAASTTGATSRMGTMAAENLLRDLAGQP